MINDPSAVPISSGLVQVVHLTWDKSARGGEGARKRAAVPWAFEVQDGHLRQARGHLQIEVLLWGKDNDFSAPFKSRHEKVPLADVYRFGCFTVSPNPEGLSVRYRWSWHYGGAPDRRFLDVGGNGDLRVRAGEWMRISSNGRFSDHDTGVWWYEQTIFNVAAFAGEPSGRIFVESEPVRDLRLLEDLW